MFAPYIMPDSNNYRVFSMICILDKEDPVAALKTAMGLRACAVSAFQDLAQKNLLPEIPHVKDFPVLVFTDDPAHACSEKENTITFFVSDVRSEQAKVTDPRVIILRGGLTYVPAQIAEAVMKRFPKASQQLETA